MPKAYQLLFSLSFLLFLSSERASASVIYADTTKPKQLVPDTNKVKPAPPGFELKPTIGLGIGMLSYFGNVKMVNSYAQNPTTSRLGYDLVFAQKINQHFEFNLYALIGTLGQYERSPTYNWNFQSQIEGGGIHIMYKILPNKDISPFFIIGIESYEFLSTTDMHDQYGNKYYYWTDGSIRSLPQNASNASTATILNPDYTYETDVRSLDMDGSGKYSEQTFAIPIGAGFMIHVNKKADFTIGTTLHYTFTDHIDGLTPGVSGPLKGTTKNDMFLMTAIGLRYDLTSSRATRGPGEIDDSRYDTVKLDASLLNDTVHDYATNDTNGISDSLRHLQYLMYMDSTGQFAKVVYDSSMIPGARNDYSNPGPTYSIEIGRYSKGVPASDMDKMLSVPDVKSTMLKDSSSVYTAGEYSDFVTARRRQDELAKQGIIDTKIVYRKGNDFIPTDRPVSNPGNAKQTIPVAATNTVTASNDKGATTDTDKGSSASDKTSGTTDKVSTTDKGTGTDKVASGSDKTSVTDKGASHDVIETGGGAVVYRVQLGAYRHKLSSTRIFTSVKNLVEMRTENGFYTYSAGSFENYKDAVAYKTELVTTGFSDAFIKAYRHGKRIALSDVGVSYVKPVKENLSDSVTHEINTMDKSQIKFNVQLGVFKGAPPKEMKEKFKKYSNLAFDEDESGNTHYNVGPYADYASAEAMKNKVIAEGIKGAFVVAYFKDKQIPLQQAISIMKK
ncbi:MAG TPA: SPOR domain-containing protein [Bacteroidia bacterium]|nr:SPOR domain-containing protein [Bacteroidia bacterium]